ncbi:MAG: 50S ribosomal protein L30 [Deltaproteobacteria bacterium]|jgi:large subunit ribosomal protein L30|nr:50S ribosomal protein L30 [Deltaproteobacteria bacterium]
MMKIKLVRSKIGASPKQRKLVETLGLRKIRQVKEVKDNAATRGIINLIPHMIEVIS